MFPVRRSDQLADAALVLLALAFALILHFGGGYYLTHYQESDLLRSQQLLHGAFDFLGPGTDSGVRLPGPFYTLLLALPQLFGNWESTTAFLSFSFGGAIAACALFLRRQSGLLPALLFSVSAAMLPDLVVVDMAENLPVEKVGAVYAELLKHVAKPGVKKVFLTEAVTFEAYDPVTGRRLGTRGEVVPREYQNRPKHDLLRKLAKNEGIPVLELEEFLHGTEVRDSGFLWWDHVHLTDAGHLKVAEWLAPRLLPLLSGHF